MDMQPRSLPKRRYILRCYVTNSHVGKSVHLLLGQSVTSMTLPHFRYLAILRPIMIL